MSASPKTNPGSQAEMEKALSAININQTTEKEDEVQNYVSTPKIQKDSKPGGFRTRFKSIGSMSALFKRKESTSVNSTQERKRISSTSPVFTNINKPLGWFGKCSLKLKFHDEDALTDIAAGVMWVFETPEKKIYFIVKSDETNDWNTKFFLNEESSVEEFCENKIKLFPCQTYDRKLRARILAKPSKPFSGTNSINEELFIEFRDESDTRKFVRRVSQIINKQKKDETASETEEATMTDCIVKRPATYTVHEPVFVHQHSSEAGI